MEQVSLDPLSDVLRTVRLKGGVFLDARFTAPWSVYSHVVAEDCRPILQNPQQMISYHYMTEGEMLISVEGGDVLRVVAGEIVLLPRNDPHILGSDQSLQPIDGHSIVQPSADGGLARVNHGGGGEPARIICGFLGSDEGFNPLIATLPPVMKIDVRKIASRGIIEASVEYAATELAEGRVASPAKLAQISELLFVEAVREFAATSKSHDNGWLRGLSDPQIGRSLALMHQDTTSSWTSESLAIAVGMSRSAFMSRFTALVGLPPIKYLTKFRLTMARTKLAETRRSVAQIAFEAGYELEDAFSRAFKREFEVSPTKWRETRS